MSHRISSRRIRREAGSALFVTVMMLVLMGFIGLAALDTVTADRQVAGFQARARVALDAADAGVATATGTLLNNAVAIHGASKADLVAMTPPLAVTALGDAVSYPYGQPTFQADPTAPSAIRYLGDGGPCFVGDGTQPVFALDGTSWIRSLWEVRVQGNAGNNVNARVQATVSVCRPAS